MSANPEQYLLDTNVLVQAHQHHYRHEFCPGFWDCIKYYSPGPIISIDKVREEIEDGRKDDDWLKGWVATTLAKDFWKTCQTPEVITEYRKVMVWADQGPRNYTPNAKTVFASKADGWVIAYAKAHKCIVVTHETEDAKTTGRVKVPCAAKALGVVSINPFEMLEQFKVKFNWQPPA